MLILMDELHKHCPKLNSTSSYCCFEAKVLIVMNAQSNNLFQVIGIRVVGKNNGGEPIDGKVLLVPNNGNTETKDYQQ